jgi:hypothetical protein
MSTNDGRVNEQVFQISVISQCLMQLMEDALLAPARKPPINSVPVAVLFREQSPLRTTASHPEDGGKKAAAFLLLADISVRMRAQDGQHLLPLLIG